MNMGEDFTLHIKRMLLEFFHLQTLHNKTIVIPFTLRFRHPSEANTVNLSGALKAQWDFNDSWSEK